MDSSLFCRYLLLEETVVINPRALYLLLMDETITARVTFRTSSKKMDSVSRVKIMDVDVFV